MSRIGFFVKRLARLDWQRFRGVWADLKKQSGKAAPALLFDLFVCGVKYNAGYMDYQIAQMYRLNAAQRKTVFTRGLSNRLVAAMNDKAHWHHFDDKAAFNTLFSEHINRRWLKVDQDTHPEALADFLRQTPLVFVKPLEGSSGVGIKKIDVKAQADTDALAAELLAAQPLILEEALIQHPEMSRLNPGSVNTIRIATLLGDKRQGIVYAFLRIGAGGCVDNVDQGGMAARVNLDTGTLTTPAADKKGHVYDRHPLTDVTIKGFQVPYFDEAKQMCLAAMQKVPQMRYIAWDVAIGPDGPLFVEGNSFPSHAVPQFAAHYPDGIGIVPEFEKFVSLSEL